MRIALFTNQFPGRTSTFFARDVGGLIDAGADIDVFPIYPLDAKLWQYVPDVIDSTVLPGDRIHHLDLSRALLCQKCFRPRKAIRFLGDALPIAGSAIMHGMLPFIKTGYASMKAWIWAQTIERQYDYVLAYWGNYAATCAYLFHRLGDRKVPFGMFLHANIDLYHNRIYMRQKLLYADDIIVVCEFNKDFVRRCYTTIFPRIEHKIYVHHLGLDLAKVRYGTVVPPSPRILGAGRLERQKGFDYLLRATRELAHRGLAVAVDLIGDGSEGKALRKLASELGIADRVKFHGWLHVNDVETAMRRATVLCHPSPDIGDAVPTVIKEALAVGTPVVATTVAGIPELLDAGRCGVLVPPANVTALADAIEGLIKNPGLRQKYSMAGRKYAEEMFDLGKNGKRLFARLQATSNSRAILCSRRG